MSTVSGDIQIQQILPLRFVHASDLHLERTIEGVTEAPAHWEQRMLDISRRAAARLFQYCIDEEIDFLLLSGNVLNANVSPPGVLLFLLEQFERLKKAGIAVYWAGGEFDSPDDWSTAFPLPENVHHFPGNSIQEYYFHRKAGAESSPVAKIAGMSRNQHRKRIRVSEFPLESGGLYTIAVANGEVEPETLAQRSIDYWAMGGSAKRHTFHGKAAERGTRSEERGLDGRRQTADSHSPKPYIVHYPGAVLARSPHDTGLYGATLVEIPLDESGQLADEPLLTPFSTSPIRWVNDRVVLDAADDAGKLADELRQRIKNYREQQKTEDLLINWLIDVPPGQLMFNLRKGNLAADLLSELRSMYGQEEPMTWSVSIVPLIPDQLAKPHYEQQTILGDFLRSIKHFQDNPAELLHLEAYIPKNWEHEEALKHLLLAEKITDEITDVSDAEENTPKERWEQHPHQKETQQKVLREAAVAGLELFSQN
ncbi:MAG: hypothetical protein LBH00_03215 [Planctomycetaceae bacterium]|jgi:hypothetical protein|nr:hypothetical protein [Planctomycetaceae bacterium]